MTRLPSLLTALVFLSVAAPARGGREDTPSGDHFRVETRAGELNPLGIKLLVYSAAEIAWGDKKARVGLGLRYHHNDPGAGGVAIWRKHRQVDFMRNIEAIHRQWSRQWGRKVAGWWIDGCYMPECRFIEDDPPNFATLKAALRTGNPNAIVTFNSGVKVPAVSTTRHDDYIAGEFSRTLPACPGQWVEKDGHKARYHSLSYLGRTWGQGATPRFSDEFVVKYTRDVTSKGGFVSWDVPPTEKGLIPEAFMKQLRALE